MIEPNVISIKILSTISYRRIIENIINESNKRNNRIVSINMGLLYDGGRTNWTRSRGANLPYIYNMTITSSSITVGSNLQVTVDAKSN